METPLDICLSLSFTQILIEAPPSSLFRLCLSDSFFCQISPSLFINHEQDWTQQSEANRFSFGPGEAFPRHASALSSLSTSGSASACFVTLRSQKLHPTPIADYVSQFLLGNRRRKAQPAASNVVVLVEKKYLRTGWESG